MGGVGEKFLKGHCYTLHTTHYTLHTTHYTHFSPCFSFLFFFFPQSKSNKSMQYKALCQDRASCSRKLAARTEHRSRTPAHKDAHTRVDAVWSPRCVSRAIFYRRSQSLELACSRCLQNAMTSSEEPPAVSIYRRQQAAAPREQI